MSRRFDRFSQERREMLLAGSAAFFSQYLAVFPTSMSRRAWAGDERVVTKPTFEANPFTLGVASGDPDPTGFVIWTRLAPKPLEGGGMPSDVIAVRWEVAEDEGFQTIVQQGETVALPALAHAVHVEVEGLGSDRWYWYRFHAGNETSPVGRSRTIPPPGSHPERLQFAFASCQHFESGLYTAYEHMAGMDLDLVFHLGDYIYEGAGKSGRVRTHVGGKLHSLEDYRNRFAQYKSDPALQTVHARFPWAVTWDDHEFENNYANLVSESPTNDPAEFFVRRMNSYQAYYEHQPLRKRSMPQGPDMKLYRRLRFGTLADFSILDTRQYRTPQPNGDGLKPQTGDALSPNATILGRKQEGWLYRGLLASPCRWNVLAQQVMMARVDLMPGPNEGYVMDEWPGYEIERRRVLEFLSSRSIANPIVLTGDIHSNWCNELTIHPESDRIAAVEFVGTSISSGGDQLGNSLLQKSILSENPQVRLVNGQRGFVRCQVDANTWRSDYHIVEYVTRPGAPLETLASFVVQNGVPGVQPA